MLFVVILFQILKVLESQVLNVMLTMRLKTHAMTLRPFGDLCLSNVEAWRSFFTLLSRAYLSLPSQWDPLLGRASPVHPLEKRLQKFLLFKAWRCCLFPERERKTCLPLGLEVAPHFPPKVSSFFELRIRLFSMQEFCFGS
ncbi:hypothetical protein VNO77_23355 [Canavalia gladiata]|uniref:Secreted protein n=1 Tax=Canavalia gladiata TaxID=3824 RepID=A0AAN9L4A1_CANGL